MFKSNKCLKYYYLKITLSLLLTTGGYIPSALATNYAVVAGSQVLIKTVNTQMLPTNTSVATLIATSTQVATFPILGGFSQNGGGCVTSNNITQIDGWNGIKINTAGIIAGFTGRISGGIVRVKKTNSATESEVYTGGMLFDARGYATAEGDVQQNSANNLCASRIGPFPSSGSSDRSNSLSAPDNAEWGNKLADVDGYMWIYTPKNIPLGTYPLNALYMSQGPGYISYASIDLTLPGDTLTVLPPPCSIATDTTINFDTTSPGGRTVSAPITYQCGDVETTTVLDAYLLANAVGSTPTATELALTSAGNKPGGVVRGYVGQGVDIDSVNCTDTTNSLSFNGAFNSKLAPVSNGITQQIPLVWQLCLKGNEAPGLATGSVWLDIGYK